MPIRSSFVLGNGESRSSVDLEACKKHGLTVGCNAIVRDFHPHVISAADQRMVEQVKATNYQGKIYTRPDWNEKLSVEAYPELPYQSDKREDNPWHWNSGPHAVNVACQAKHAGWFTKKTNLCFLLGFDLTQTDVCNNIYKDTDGYDNKVVDPKYWHHQLNQLFVNYPQVTFVWVAPKSYKCPIKWTKHDNFYRETVEQFNQFISDFTNNKRLVDQFA